MRTLILMRHGAAVESHDAPSDYARALTPQGRFDVQAQIHLLKMHAPEGIISSSALRTTETASLIASALTQTLTLTLKPKLYHAQASDYFEVLQTIPDNVHTILLIGHNPSISDLASQLAKTKLNMAPADLGIFHTECDSAWYALSIRDFNQIV